MSIGTFIATNYISIAAGASVSGAVLSTSGVTLSSATIILQRDLYTTSVNMLSAQTFVLIGATALTNTVRF
jgi:hypothetical protein